MGEWEGWEGGSMGGGYGGGDDEVGYGGGRAYLVAPTWLMCSFYVTHTWSILYMY